MKNFGSGKCPVMHGGSTTQETSPTKWWPKALNLDMLHQHDIKTDPLGSSYSYEEELKKLDFSALEKDMHELLRIGGQLTGAITVG